MKFSLKNGGKKLSSEESFDGLEDMLPILAIFGSIPITIFACVVLSGAFIIAPLCKLAYEIRDWYCTKKTPTRVEVREFYGLWSVKDVSVVRYKHGATILKVEEWWNTPLVPNIFIPGNKSEVKKTTYIDIDSDGHVDEIIYSRSWETPPDAGGDTEIKHSKKHLKRSPKYIGIFKSADRVLEKYKREFNLEQRIAD